MIMVFAGFSYIPTGDDSFPTHNITISSSYPLYVLSNYNTNHL